MSRPIRVLVADDHPLVRAGIRMALAGATDIVIVAEVADAGEAHLTCQKLQPDVLLLDLVMPGPTPTATVAAIQTHCPRTRIVVLTAYDDDAHVHALVTLGVIGYVLKEDTMEAAATAVRAVMAGGNWFSAGVMPALLAHNEKIKGSSLTPREREILALVAEGQRNGEIARTLSVSTKTVESHIHNILAKLGVRSRTEALQYSYQQQLLAADVRSARPSWCP